MFCYTGQCQLQLEHSGYVSAGKFHPVTPHLVTTGTNNCIQVWDSRHPEVPIRTLTHKEELGQVSEHSESFSVLHDVPLIKIWNWGWGGGIGI